MNALAALGRLDGLERLGKAGTKGQRSKGTEGAIHPRMATNSTEDGLHMKILAVFMTVT